MGHDIATEDDAACSGGYRISRHLKRVAWIVFGRTTEDQHRYIAGHGDAAVVLYRAGIVDLDEVRPRLGPDPRGPGNILDGMRACLLKRDRDRLGQQRHAPLGAAS